MNRKIIRRSMFFMVSKNDMTLIVILSEISSFNTQDHPQTHRDDPQRNADHNRPLAGEIRHPHDPVGQVGYMEKRQRVGQPESDVMIEQAMKGTMYLASVMFSSMPEYQSIKKLGALEVPIIDQTSIPYMRQVGQWLKKRIKH